MKVLVGLVFLCILGFAVAQLALPPGQGQPPPPKLKIGGPDPGMHYLVVNPSEVRELLPDGPFVYAAYDWTVVKLAKKDLRIVAWRSLAEVHPEPPPSGLKIDTVNFQSVDIREALRDVFRKANVSYSIAPDVQGRVTAIGTNVPLETAVRLLANQVGATYRIEGGIYQVITTAAAAMYPQPKIGKMAMDGSDLYVSLGLRVVRLSKKDLSIVFERNIAISPDLSEKSGR